MKNQIQVQLPSLRTNISPGSKALLKLMFYFPRWDVLVPRTAPNAFLRMQGQPNPGILTVKKAQSGGPLDTEPQNMEHRIKIE